MTRGDFWFESGQRQPDKGGNEMNRDSITIVTVRWFDGYKEDFECSEVRCGSDYLWMRLYSGKDRWIPVKQVRWYSLSPESHQ